MNDPIQIIQEIKTNKLIPTLEQKYKLCYNLRRISIDPNIEEKWIQMEAPFNHYQISNLGKIKSFRFYNKSTKSHYIYPSIDLLYGSYYTLYTSSTSYYGIRTDKLVVSAFSNIPIKQIKTVIHLDGNIFNNCINNLKPILK